MQAKTERFEMRFDPILLARVDQWRADHGGHPSRAEAVRQLVEVGLQQGDAGELRFSDGEKMIISMLQDVYKNLGIKNAEIDPDFVVDAILGGHYWALQQNYEFLFHRHAEAEQTVSQVVNILDMWSFMEEGHNDFSNEQKQAIVAECGLLGKGVKFHGFDENNEKRHYAVARFMIKRMNMFQTFKGRELNSHSQVLNRYLYMLETFESIRPKVVGRRLNVDEIISIIQTGNRASR